VRALPSLIRLHKWQLDEQRRKVGALEALKLSLEGDLRRLETEVGRERAAAAGSIESLATFPYYLQEAKARRVRLEQSLVEIEHSLAAAREEAAAAYRELRKYETALEAHERRLLATAERRRQGEQDEIALGMHRRQRASESAA